MQRRGWVRRTGAGPVLLIAACGSRSALDLADEQETDAGVVPPEVRGVPDDSCLAASTDLVVLSEAGVWAMPEVHDIVPRDDGFLFVVGAGQGLARCADSDVQGAGEYFIALLTPELRVVWERRVSSYLQVQLQVRRRRARV